MNTWEEEGAIMDKILYLGKEICNIIIMRFLINKTDFNKNFKIPNTWSIANA